MWAIKLLMKIIVLPMILVIAVARLGVDLAIKLYGFVSFWLWVFLGIVVIMTVCQQNWMQTLLAIVIGDGTVRMKRSDLPNQTTSISIDYFMDRLK